jgi:hypothetical protein
MKSLLALIGLAALLFLGWTNRDRIPGPWNRAAGEQFATEVSPAAAAAAEAKLERLRTERDTVRMSSAEFTSYLRYRFQDRLAGQLESPVVRFSGDTVTLSGRFPTDRLPDTRQVRAVRGFLPDTADVRVTGALRTMEGGRGALRVDNVAFARLPIPPEVYTQALERLGRRDEAGLAPNEYAFPLPPGVGSARVEGGTLVLAPGSR